MKKKILFIAYCLCAIASLFGKSVDNSFSLGKAEDIKEIVVRKRNINDRQQDIVVKLNESQKNEFLERIKFSRQERYLKVMLLYEATIYYSNNESTKIWLNGSVIKDEEGKAYRLENNMRLFVNSLFSEEDQSKLYKEKIIENNGRNIHVYQANYSRKDLVRINGVTSNANPAGTYDLEWKIGQELIDAQTSFLKKKYLKDYIKSENLRKLADSYIKLIFYSDEPLNFSSYELHPLDDKKEKWIIYFIYVTNEHKGKKNYWDEVVFMMPNGTVVISDANYENIKFDE